MARGACVLVEPNDKQKHRAKVCANSPLSENILLNCCICSVSQSFTSLCIYEVAEMDSSPDPDPLCLSFSLVHSAAHFDATPSPPHLLDSLCRGPWHTIVYLGAEWKAVGTFASNMNGHFSVESKFLSIKAHLNQIECELSRNYERRL